MFTIGNYQGYISYFEEMHFFIDTILLEKINICNAVPWIPEDFEIVKTQPYSAKITLILLTENIADLVNK